MSPSFVSREELELIAILTECDQIQHNYGKNDFKVKAGLFLKYLKFPHEIMMAALEEWLLTQDNFPTLNNIRLLCEKKLEAAYDPIQEEIQRFHAAGFGFINESHFSSLYELSDQTHKEPLQLEPIEIRKIFVATCKIPASRKGIEWEIKRISSVYPELFKNEGALNEWYNALRHVPYLYLKTAVDIALSGDQKADLKTLTMKVDDIFKTYGA